jgi:ArsR family transcriptional regulator, arsenate/arsenite/antimonite-responsive transcriptional repressor
VRFLASHTTTLSHHLKRLVDSGVMRTRGEGTFQYYSADYGSSGGLGEILNRVD